MAGAPAAPHPSSEVFNLIFKRRGLAGSLIGGIRETQQMLDFCTRHGIVSDIETIAMDYIDTAYERIRKSDVKYRLVIDMATIRGQARRSSRARKVRQFERPAQRTWDMASGIIDE